MESKIKKNLLGLFLLLGVMFFIASVSAVTTMQTPATSSTISRATIFNVNTTDVPGLQGILVNLTFYAKSASTANSSWVAIGQNNSLNLTLRGNDSFTTINVNPGFLEDSNDYIFNVTIKNETTGVFFGQDTNTGIIIDNTAPQTPSSLSPADNNLVSSATTQTYSATVTGTNTTSCTISIGKNGGSYVTNTATHSGNTCTYTDTAYSTSADNALYSWYFIASDGTNSSTSSVFNNNVQLPGTGGGAGLQVAQQNAKSGKAFAITSGNGQVSPIIIFGGLALIILGVWYFTKKK